jgi:hypothetical protein
MLEKHNLNNGQENSVKNTEVFKQTLKIEIKENPNSELSKLVEKRKEEDLLKIEQLRKELGAPGTDTKTPTVEKEVGAKEIADRISTEKVVEEIARKQQEQKERYNVSPEELGILAWEDKAIEAQKNIDIAESRLALSEEEFKEMFGEMSVDMKEAIPRMLERNKKLVEEYTTIAKGLREKLKEQQNESK